MSPLWARSWPGSIRPLPLPRVRMRARLSVSGGARSDPGVPQPELSRSPHPRAGRVGKPSAERREYDAVAVVNATGLYGFVQRERDTRRRCIPVLLDIDDE